MQLIGTAIEQREQLIVTFDSANSGLDAGFEAGMLALPVSYRTDTDIHQQQRRTMLRRFLLLRLVRRHAIAKHDGKGRATG